MHTHIYTHTHMHTHTAPLHIGPRHVHIETQHTPGFKQDARPADDSGSSGRPTTGESTPTDLLKWSSDVPLRTGKQLSLYSLKTKQPPLTTTAISVTWVWLVVGVAMWLWRYQRLGSHKMTHWLPAELWEDFFLHSQFNETKTHLKSWYKITLFSYKFGLMS